MLLGVGEEDAVMMMMMMMSVEKMRVSVAEVAGMSNDDGEKAAANFPGQDSMRPRTTTTTTTQRRAVSQYIEFKPLRGAIDEVGRDSAGFWHRGAAWWALMSAFWSATSDEGRVGEYVADWMEAHKKLADGMKREGVYGGQYAGYVNHDGHSSVSEELEAYYGAHTARMEQIRKRWDPHGRFKHGRWCRAARTGACTIT
eukprot:979935-Rhodomonas_salina.2